MNKHEDRSGFVGPFILVGIGILFLLNNLGLIQVNFWQLASTLWPVILIGIGLDMLIGRRSTTGSLLALLVTAIFLVGGTIFVGVGPGTTSRGEVTEIRYAPGTVTEADIRISTSTGRLTVGILGESGVLVAGTVRLAGNEEVKETSSEEGGKAVYRLSSEGVGVVGVAGNESVWDLRINGEIPSNLDINTGAGEAEVNLERARLTGLKVDLGIGATTITLPRSGIFSGEISGGIGKLVIRVPESLAVRLHVDTGIGQVQVTGDFTQSGENLYLSAAAQESGESATLNVSSGIGQVVIEKVAGE
jgi:hypothetical protein